MFGELFKLWGAVGLDTAEVDKGLEDISKKLEKQGKDMSKLGKNLTLKLTTPLIGIGTAAFMTGANFEEAMSKVKAISGATGSDFDSLSNLAREMGATTKFSATQSAEALTYMAMAGWDTQSMLDGLSGIMLLSASSGEDLAMVSDIVTDALTAFGMSAKDSTKFADLLAKASSSSNTNVGLLGESFKYVAPLFGAVGFSAEDAALALGLMANAGIKGGQSGTALRAAVSRLVNPIGEAGAVIEKLGINVSNADGTVRPFRDIMSDLRERFAKLTPEQQAQASATLFGQEAMSGMLAIINASEEDFNKLADATTNYNGTAQEMADIMMDNSKGSIQIFKSALEEMFIAMSDHIIPVVTDVIVKLTEWVSWFGNLDASTQQTIMMIGGFLIALGPALIIMGKVIGVVSFLTSLIGGMSLAFKGATLATNASKVSAVGFKIAQFASAAATKAYTLAIGIAKVATSAFGAVMAFVTSPIGLVVLAIGALIAIGVLLWKNWDTVSAFAKKIWEGISTMITGVWNSIVETVTSAMNSVLEKIKSAWELVKAVVQVAIMFIVELIRFAIELLLAPWRFIWENFKHIIEPIWESIKAFISTTISAISKVISDTFNAILTFISTTLNAISTVITTVMNAIKKFFSDVWNAIVNTVTPILQAFRDFIVGLWTGISTAVSNIMTAIKNKISEIWNNIVTTVTNVVTRIKEFVTTTFNNIKTAISERIEAIRNTVSNVFKKIGDAIMGPVEKAKNFVKDMIDKIKGFFNFKWSLPKLKLPSVKITGKFNLLPPEVPKFSLAWNAKGGIFDTPTIFNTARGLQGVGEKDPEAIIPLTRDVLGGIGEGIVNSTDMNNPTFIEKLDAIIDLLIEIITNDPKLQVVLSNGVLVGELLPLIDERMGRRAERKARGG